jgi:phage-related protein
MKPIKFLGTSLYAIREMEEEAQDKIGTDLLRVQFGGQPMNYRAMVDVGAGVYEIKARTDDGAYRVFYVAKFEEAVYVLHAFQKKTQQTSKQDIELGKRRYKDLVEYRRNEL